MNEFTPSPELEEKVRAVLATADPSPGFVGRLRERLLSQAAEPPRRRTRLVLRPLWAWCLGVLLVLVLAALTVGPGNLVAAMQRLLGYIPGVGLVDDSAGLRVLAEPVTLEREGITVTVEQAVLDSERTVIIFQVDGIPAEAFPNSEEGPYCFGQPQLILLGESGAGLVEGRDESLGTDFITLDPSLGEAGRGWGSGYEAREVFPAIPRAVTEAVLFVPCLMDTAPGAAPEDWELRLHFIPAPADVTIVPVLEVTPAVETAAAPEPITGTGLVLERTIELEDSYILIGSFHQGEDLPGAMVMGISAWPEITDANGQRLPFEPASDVDLSTSEMGLFPWAYQIPKGFVPPLTIMLEAVDVELPADVSFTFDSGPEPQIDQEWVLNRDLQVAGYSVRLVSAARRGGARQSGYEFFFRAEPAVSSVSIEDPEHVPVGGYGGGSLGEFSAGLVYDGPVPTGLLTFRITRLIARHAGPWTLEWSPPEGSAPVTPLALPRPCLTLDDWREAAANPGLTPDGLSGRLIAYGRIVDDGDRLSPENAGVFVVDAATGERQVLGQGTWPSLSEDGSRALYGWTDGLHIVDLASGEDRVVPGTTTNDYNARFSPDGSRLAFVRVDDLNLYLVNLDGSGLRRLTDGPEYELLLGWSADGTRLFYGVPGADGVTLRSLELSSGAVQDEFIIDAKDLSAAYSPDGGRIAFVARVPGALSYGLYLAQPDGSGIRLIAQLDHWGIADPVWSPDGGWLLVNIVNPDVPVAEITPALIDPETCRTIPLVGVDGQVADWAMP